MHNVNEDFDIANWVSSLDFPTCILLSSNVFSRDLKKNFTTLENEENI